MSCTQALLVCMCECKDYIQQRDIQLFVKSLYIMVDGMITKHTTYRYSLCGSYCDYSLSHSLFPL